MQIYFASLQGKRSSNEDAHFIIENMDGRNKKYKKINLYGVFDGHGGKEVSTFVSENLPKYLIDRAVPYPLQKVYVSNVYDAIQKQLQQTSFAKHTGSTGLVVAHYIENGVQYLNIINNGDSRCIMCKNRIAMPLTRDHKPNWPMEIRRIIKIGGKGKIKFDGHDWRVKDLSVSRAFGDLDATPYVTHRPELFKYMVDPDDLFVVLGCDGLYDYLSNQDIVNFVLNRCYDDEFNRVKNNDIAKQLAEYAIEKGSTDNISVILIFLK